MRKGYEVQEKYERPWAMMGSYIYLEPCPMYPLWVLEGPGSLLLSGRESRGPAFHEVVARMVLPQQSESRPVQ